ncbi:hypothetical protein Scep_018947 [Stephania cephalantha]|uniref:Uncharacterized protein n=1 Tax=Stephania cephalantha TaxID=152367 RepID=A0AAP0NLP3_9MAGN
MYDDEGQSRRQRRTAQMTTRASKVATADGEGFKGSDDRRRGLQKAATANEEGFIGSDDRRRGLQKKRRQMARPPADTTKTRRLNRKTRQQLNPQPLKPRARKGVPQDEGFHVSDYKEREIIIAFSGIEGEAFESFDDLLRNEE